MNKIITIMIYYKLYRNTALLLILSTITACADYNSPYTDVEFQGNTRIFDGTIYDYLSQADAETGLRYDSMKLIIDGIEGRREALSDLSANMTVFAVPDECFCSTINICNRVRQSQSKTDLQLSNLLIEPFSVFDTVYVITSGASSTLIEEIDTLVTERHYDYRAQLDSLLCRYIFEDAYDFDVISENFRGIEAACYLYKLKMNITGERQAASGTLNSGRKRIIFSDMNESKLTSSWVRSVANQINIRTRNGVVHVLTTGHEFSFDDFIYRFKDYGYEK